MNLFTKSNGAVLVLALFAASCAKEEAQPRTKPKPVKVQEIPQNIEGIWKGSGKALVLDRVQKCVLTLDIQKLDNKIKFNKVLYECADGRRAGLDGATSLEIGTIETNGEFGLFFNGLAVGSISKDLRKMNSTIRQQNAEWEIQLELPKKSSKLNAVFQRFRDTQSIIFESSDISLVKQKESPKPNTTTTTRDRTRSGNQNESSTTNQRHPWLNPKKASSYKNAKYVLCKSEYFETFVSFPEANLYENSWGIIMGEVGPATLGIRRNSKSPFQTYNVEYPGLITNGPKVTITAYDLNANIMLNAITYDFVNGNAELSLDDNLSQLNCTYYQSEGYKIN